MHTLHWCLPSTNAYPHWCLPSIDAYHTLMPTLDWCQLSTDAYHLVMQTLHWYPPSTDAHLGGARVRFVAGCSTCWLMTGSKTMQISLIPEIMWKFSNFQVFVEARLCLETLPSIATLATLRPTRRTPNLITPLTHSSQSYSSTDLKVHTQIF